MYSLTKYGVFYMPVERQEIPNLQISYLSSNLAYNTLTLTYFHNNIHNSQIIEMVLEPVNRWTDKGM